MARTLAPWRAATPKIFDDLRQEMNELMERFIVPDFFNGREVGVFNPRTNVAETDKEFEVVLDLPGMKAEDFNVEIREGALWIGGERKCESAQEGKTWRRVGCQYGRFEELIPLGMPVNADKVSAEYKDGVLKVIVPKDEGAQPRKIEVKS